MKFNHCNRSVNRVTKVLLIIAGVLWLPSIGYAINPDTMLENISAQLPYLYEIVSSFSYLAGVVFVLGGLYKLKEYGESKMASSSKLDLKEPLSYLIIGAMLVYLPSTLNTMLVSVYGSAELSPYVGIANPQNPFNEMGQVIVDVVQFVGFVAFIRGLLLMHRVGVGQAQQGSFNKGVTHLIGGVIAMNIVEFVKIVGNTLGMSN